MVSTDGSTNLNSTGGHNLNYSSNGLPITQNPSRSNLRKGLTTINEKGGSSIRQKKGMPLEIGAIDHARAKKKLESIMGKCDQAMPGLGAPEKGENHENMIKSLPTFSAPKRGHSQDARMHKTQVEKRNSVEAGGALQKKKRMISNSGKVIINGTNSNSSQQREA